MKILNQFFVQQITRSYCRQKSAKLCSSGIGTLAFLLIMEVTSPAVFAQPTTTLPKQNFNAVNSSINSHPVILAEAGNVIFGSDNFNPGLQLPPAKTEELKTQPQPRSNSAPSSPPANLANPPVPSPVRREIEVSSDANNFNPGLILPPPKTELPPKPPQLKPTSPPPALALPGQAKAKPRSIPTAPVVFQSDTQTPGRSRPGGSWPQAVANPQATTPEQPKPVANSSATQSQPSKPTLAKGAILILESVVPNFQNTRNESGQINQTAETTVNFLLENGDRIKLVTGYNTFIKPGFTTVNNVPINLSWETKIDSVKIEPSIGVNLFNRLPASPTYGLKASIPVTSGLTLSAAVESGAYKFNTETIQNQISAVRYGPGILWQIDPDTSFLAIYKFGNYSDGNTENQLFSRLERKSGQFWIAANLFSWGYGQNIGSASGYFSPPDFLAYSGEVGVEGNVLFDSLSCRVSATIGNQQSSGASTVGQAFQSLCKTKFSPSLEASFGYGFGNSRKDFSSEETGNTRTITGGLMYKF